ncbi:unnamed protein product [Lampetra planeri]
MWNYPGLAALRPTPQDQKAARLFPKMHGGLGHGSNSAHGNPQHGRDNAQSWLMFSVDLSHGSLEPRAGAKP